MSVDNNFDDNQFEEYRDAFEPEPGEEGGGEGGPGGGRNNRPFIAAVAVIGGIFLVAIIALVAYILLNGGNRAAQVQNDTAQIDAENTAIAQQATQLFQGEILQLTEKAIPSTTPTPTAVIAVPTTTPAPTETLVVNAIGDAERTATVAAFLTSVAVVTSTAQGTPASAAATATALPTTGIMDNVGLPGMLAAAVLLIVVLFVARRIRLSTNQ